MTKKHLTKIAVLSILTVIVLFNCERENSEPIDASIPEPTVFETSSTTRIVPANDLPEVADSFGNALKSTNIQNAIFDTSIYELTRPNGEQSYSALVYVGETSDNNFHNIVVKRSVDGRLGTPYITEYQTSMPTSDITMQNYTNITWEINHLGFNNISQKGGNSGKTTPDPDPCLPNGTTIPLGGGGINAEPISGHDFSDNIVDSDSGNYTPPATGGTVSGFVEVCHDEITLKPYFCNGPNGGSPHGPDTCGDPTTNYGGTGVNTVVVQSCVPVYVTVSTHVAAIPDYVVSVDSSSPLITNCQLQRVRDGLQSQSNSLTDLGSEILQELISQLDANTDYCGTSSPPLPTPLKGGIKSSKTANSAPCDPNDANVVLPSSTWRLLETMNRKLSLFDPGLSQAQIRWILNPVNSSDASDLLFLLETKNGSSTAAQHFARNAINLEIILDSDFEIVNTNRTPEELDPCCPGDCCPDVTLYSNDRITYEYGIQPVVALIDSSFNLILASSEVIGSDAWVGSRIRKMMLELGIDVPADIDNTHLAELYRIRKRDNVVIVEYRPGLLKSMLDVGLDTLNVLAFLSPAKGGGPVLFAKFGGGVSISKLANHIRNITISSSKIDDLVTSLKAQAKTVLDGTGEFKNVGGHHPLSKIAFKSDKFYDLQKAFSVSINKLNEISVGIHAKITGQQNSLYSAFAKKNEVLTIDKMADIEIQAMVNAGVPRDVATGWVVKALENLKAQGVKVITNIPWNGLN